jgi:hypothetical protein
VETVEKSNCDFSTVPTALGKLVAKNASSFPQFPQLPLLISFYQKKKKPSRETQ